MVDLYCIRLNFLHVIIRWIYFLLFLFFNYSMFQIRGIHLSFSGGLAIFFNFSHHVASLLGGYHLINLLSRTGSFLCSFPNWPAGISSFSSSLATPAFLLRWAPRLHFSLLRENPSFRNRFWRQRDQRLMSKKKDEREKDWVSNPRSSASLRRSNSALAHYSTMYFKYTINHWNTKRLS